MNKGDQIKMEQAIHSYASGKSSAGTARGILRGLGYKTDLRSIKNGKAGILNLDGGFVKYINFKRGGLVKKRK